MKLTDIDTVRGSDEGAIMQVKHPGTGETLDDTWIRVAGPDSQIAKRRRAEIRRKLRRKGQTTIDFDALEAEAAETRVAVTLEWGGIELDDGPVALTPDNVRQVYDRFPWLAEQVDEFQADRANFIAAPSKRRGSTSGSQRG